MTGRRVLLLCLLFPGMIGCGTMPVPEGIPDPVVAPATTQPESARAHYQRGNQLFDLDRYAEAADAYEAATLAEPDFADAYTNLGLSLRYLGRFDEAVVAYERALNLQPDDLTTLRNRKALAEVMGDGPRYADCVRRLAVLLPDDPTCQRDLADLCLAEENYAQAADLYERLALTGVSDGDLYYNLGLCHFRLDHFDAAEAAWKEALQLDNRHEASSRGLAVLYWTTGDYTRAWAMISQCRRLDIRVDPDFLDILRRDSGKKTAL